MFTMLRNLLNPMGKDKKVDFGAMLALAASVAALAWQAAQAVSGKTVRNKVKVRGHRRKDGRGGYTWVDAHERDFPL